jgi:hypothetical protein
MKLINAGNILKSAVIIFVFTIIVCLPSRVSAAGGVIVSVSGPTQVVSSGTQFTVNVTVQPNEAIAGAQFNLSFNPSLVSVNSVTEGNLFNQNGARTYFIPGTINNTDGTITGVEDAIFSSGQIVSKPGTFAVISMTALAKSGTSTLTLSNVIVGDINGQSLAVSLDNGQVVVGDGPTPTTTATVVRMYILAIAVCFAALLIIALAIFMRLRRRNLLKKGSRLK